MNVVRSRARTTKWNLFFHYVAIALAFASGLVLVPLYLKYIPLDLYGAWLATGNIVVWLTAVDPGLSTVLQQRVGIAYGRGDLQDVRAMLAAGLLIAGGVSASILVLGLVVSGQLPTWLDLAPTIDGALLKRAFLLAVTGTAVTIFSFAITAVNQGLQSSVGIGLVYGVVNLLGIILTVALLYNGFGLLAIPVATLFRGLGLTLGNAGYLSWRLVSERIGFLPSLQQIPVLTRLVSYTFLARAGSVVANNADAFIVARFLGAEVVPVLTLTRKAPDMSRLLVERPAVAFMPAVSHLVGAGQIDKARQVLLRLVRLILWLLGLLWGGFFAFNDDFVRLWVGPELFAGSVINVVICLGLVVTVISNSLANLCLALGNIKGNSLTSVAQSMLFVPLIVLGVNYLGLLGVVLAPLLAMLATSIWYYPRSFARLLRLSLPDCRAIGREVIYILVVVVPLTLGFYWVHLEGWIQFGLSVLGFIAGYTIGLWLLSRSFQAEGTKVIHKSQIAIFSNWFVEEPD